MIGRTSNTESPDLAEVSHLIQGVLTQLGNIETEVSSTDRAVQLMTLKLDDLINRLDRNQFLEQHSMANTDAADRPSFLPHIKLPALAPFLGLVSVDSGLSTDKIDDCDPPPKAGARGPRQKKKNHGNRAYPHAK